jgi:NhaP-type Na+/H+ or K+/H+ antiporter
MGNATTSFAARLPGLKSAMPEWWPILVGLMALYIPTFYGLFTGLWASRRTAPLYWPWRYGCFTGNGRL